MIAIIFLIVSIVVRLASPLCIPPDTTWTGYVFFPPPVEFEGTVTSGGCLTTRCVGPGSGSDSEVSRLGDGYYGTADLNVSAVHAWDRTRAETVIIQFQFPSDVKVGGINLYFYNIPSRNIGLPYDTVLSSVSSTIVGNQVLSQNDNQLRSVTLIPTSVLHSNRFTILFRFSNTDKIDWLLLSELEICTSVTIVPNPTPISFTSDIVSKIVLTSRWSSFSLSCSVENEGRFVWSWTLPSGVTQQPTYILDVGRTSALEFSRVTGDTIGDFQCHVNYSGLAGDPGLSTVFNVTLILAGALEEESSVVKVAVNDITATLRCDLYGILPPGEPSVTWFLGDTRLTNDTTYTITSEVGDLQIQNGGNQNRPSVLSVLSIDVIDFSSQTFMYSCHSVPVTASGSRTILLIVPNPIFISFTDDNVSDISPTSIKSNINLSCSVENQGRFIYKWSWTLPSGDTQQSTYVLDSDRTSVLELSQVSSDDRGDYQCHVDYIGFGGGRGLNATFTIFLSLEGFLEEERKLVPVTDHDATITLSCHLYGYLPLEKLPSITWLLGNTMLTNDTTYTITTEVGDRFLQSGGSQIRPSLRSFLRINFVNNTVRSDQNYFCKSNLGQRQITVSKLEQVIDFKIISEMSDSSNTMSSIYSQQTTDVITIGILAACIAVLIIIIVILLMIVLKLKSRFGSNSIKNSREDYRMGNEECMKNEAQGYENRMGNEGYEDPDLFRAPARAELQIELDKNKAYGKFGSATGST